MEGFLCPRSSRLIYTGSYPDRKPSSSWVHFLLNLNSLIKAEIAQRQVGVSRAVGCALEHSFSSTLNDEFWITKSHLTIV